MLPGTVQVPADLLLDPNLSAPAKLIWMGTRLHGSVHRKPSEVAAYCGLAHDTVSRGIAELEAAGWYQEGPVRPQSHTRESMAEVPTELIGDDRVWAQGRVLYGILQLLSTSRRRSGRCTYRKLCDLTHLSSNTIKKAMRELVESGWLEITQLHKHLPVDYRLTRGQSTADAIEVARARRRLKIGYRGEALMLEWLSLLVPSKDYLNNARPGDFTSPLTGQPLELDRRYAAGVAFEFNGEQHDHPTERFSAEKVIQQQGRDLIKQGLCLLQGIKLVIVKAEDLSLDGMRRKVGDLLPTRDLKGHERLISFLEDASRDYREGAERGRRDDKAAQQPDS